MTFVPNHLAAFKNSVEAGHDVNEWDTETARDFARGALGTEASPLLKDLQNRTTLKRLATNPDIDTETVCLAILAWGGMHRGNRDWLYRNPTRAWLSIAEGTRADKLDRVSSYDAFRELRVNKDLRGMGPAYYTKLIHFLLPRRDDDEPQAYIMDQWAACSVNLLVGEEPVVLMNSSYHYSRTRKGLRRTSSYIVSDANTGNDYDCFCAAIERLAKHFGKSGDEIDRALMSNGGKTKHPWRAHVIEHRKP